MRNSSEPGEAQPGVSENHGAARFFQARAAPACYNAASGKTSIKRCDQMKFPLSLWLFALFLAGAPASSPGDELTSEALEGKWLYTHIILEGGREISVNYIVEFGADGTAVYYDSAGLEKDRGTYRVGADAIIYSDRNGEQTWKLVLLSDGKLQVDHRGAGMFFERQ
jgi:hypothetical protein